MEIEELKTIWKQYDLKLDNLEKLNKKLVMETLSKKPQRKINYMKFQSISALILIPIVLVVALHENFRIENIDLKFFIGAILMCAVIIYLAYFNFKCFKSLKEIKIGYDSIIESARKINNYKAIVNNRQRRFWISYPLLFAGVILIAWKDIKFDNSTILFLAGLLVFNITWAIKQFKIQRNRIEILHKEILDLKEYEN